MHDDTELVFGRVERFLREVLVPACERDSAGVTLAAWTVGGEPVPFADVPSAPFVPFEVGEPWGAPWDTVWFDLRAQVPAEWRDDEVTAIELVVDLGFGHRPGFQAEGLVYTRVGRIVKGLAPRNNAVPLTLLDDPDARAVHLFIEAAANPDVTMDYSFVPTPLGLKSTAGTQPLYALRRAELVLRDRMAWELVQDVRVLLALARELSEHTPRRADIVRALDRMVDVVDPFDVGSTAGAGRAVLAPTLASPAWPSSHEVVAVGHAHIDSAWLWPLRETVRKVARTFSNVLALARQHPDFRFAASSAQQYAWIKERYPELFERIRAAVARGEFVPVGGMWVEADTMMPGGESMVRQFLEGSTFFRDEFGIDTTVVWLPDSFGYSGALPQIARGSGARYFLTQKLSWNQTNRMPHHTFHWEGIDGSRVFTHFPPVDTYNSDLSARELAHAERGYREHGRGSVSLAPFGWGDGGGGPTREMLANAARARSLEGSPRVTLGTPEEFFRRAEAEYPRPPVWSGEMYLELHRGIFTSQLRAKQGNRRSEHLLREAELWCTSATLRRGVPYPAEELRALWQNVLLLQFHDILPGSSIAWVYQDAEEHYADVAARAERLIESALRVLVGTGHVALGVNAGPRLRLGVPELGIGPVALPGSRRRVTAVEDEDGLVVLDNGRIRAAIDEIGGIVSLVDHRTGRDAIAPQTPAAVFVVHRDVPNQWDAWDIDEHFRQSRAEFGVGSARRVERDEHAVTVSVTGRIGGRSALTVRLTLRGDADALDLDIAIDWRERQSLLKLEVPLDISTETVAAETQFGYVRRPTHRNTSWDAARFEVCAHRWVHVGEQGYGVAIANDSTYGYDVTTRSRPGGGRLTVVGLSLVRAPLYPDPEADQGVHRMSVAIRPDAGVREAIEEGYRLNLQERIVLGAEPVASLVKITDRHGASSSVLVEAVKLAHDGSGDLIVRLYESEGARAAACVRLDVPIERIVRADLLERPLEDLVLADTAGVDVTVRPFEIVTVRVVVAPE
ncbi:glycoside hydrolase family 38 C-terminal domain-containing protein [Galbitalea sp. SE-J8]|uniref:alpha-mannosidase n=1 Tax=Galbitalea sp. SE-J8 TaxID=3054952 RepID=UPI00259C9AA6|nr:glycoside hydrolase family 38 C-terminal domain-containing protein [Galbitalea sp. SE-J8]MDM4761547.1 glycoside hydrolase family 38 C-terminal domain-containing protein [Galbitalea sp. SE-J8]